MNRMKNVWNSTAATLLCLAATLLLTTACSQENTVDPTLPQGEPVEVEFQIPGFVEMSDGGTTRATSALAEGTTVRIVACMGGDTPSTSRLPDADQTYYVKNGRLVPCTVDKDGKFVSETPNTKMVLEPDSYFFWACTPALEITEASDGSGIYSVSVPQNMDFALSSSENKIITFSGMVVLNPFERKCARLQLKVKRDDASTGITAMTVNSATLTGFSADSQEAYITYWFDHILVGTGTKSATTTAFTKDATNPLISTGDLFLLPTTSDIKPAAAIPIQASFDVTYTALGIEYNETFTGNLNLSVARGKSYTLNTTISKLSGMNLTMEWEENKQENNIGAGVWSYPYVYSPNNTYNVIISKDQYGTSGAAFHTFWTQTWVHPQSHGFSNTLSPHLTVARYVMIGTWEYYTSQTDVRLPTIAEENLIRSLILAGKITTTGYTHDYFWTSAFDPNNPNNAMAISLQEGKIVSKPKTEDLGLHLIQDQYPHFQYNKEGKLRIAVLKDKYGSVVQTPGMENTPLHDYWLTSPSHTETDPANSCAAILEIAGSDAPNPTNPSTTRMSWIVATDPNNPACKAPWRLPTQLEGDLINIMAKVEPSGLTFTPNMSYWTATKVSTNTQEMYFSFKPGANYNPSDSATPDWIGFSVRCVRDL